MKLKKGFIHSICYTVSNLLGIKPFEENLKGKELELLNAIEAAVKIINKKEKIDQITKKCGEVRDLVEDVTDLTSTKRNKSRSMSQILLDL